MKKQKKKDFDVLEFNKILEMTRKHIQEFEQTVKENKIKAIDCLYKANADIKKNEEMISNKLKNMKVYLLECEDIQEKYLEEYIYLLTSKNIGFAIDYIDPRIWVKLEKMIKAKYPKKANEIIMELYNWHGINDIQIMRLMNY